VIKLGEYRSNVSQSTITLVNSLFPQEGLKLISAWFICLVDMGSYMLVMKKLEELSDVLDKIDIERIVASIREDREGR